MTMSGGPWKEATDYGAFKNCKSYEDFRRPYSG